ncbi:conserved hypothetical protein [Desulfovibrionales bacterium]
MQFDIKKQDIPGNPKKFRIELTRTGFIGFGTALIVGITWIFIIGVAVGRGWWPDRKHTEQAKLMPTNPNISKDNDTIKKMEMIKPEELQFFDRLKKDPTAVKPTPFNPTQALTPISGPATSVPAVASQPTKGPLKDTPASDKPQDMLITTKATDRPQEIPIIERNMVGITQLPTKTTNTPIPNPTNYKSGSEAKKFEKKIADRVREKSVAANTPKTKSANESRFDYLYQAAAFNDAPTAASCRDKICATGLKAFIQIYKDKDKIMHRVMVSFQGKPDDTRELKIKLGAMNLGAPIMRSKKPIQ